MLVYLVIVIVAWIIHSIKYAHIIPSLVSNNPLMLYLIINFMMSNVIAIIGTIIFKILELLLKIFNG